MDPKAQLEALGAIIDELDRLLPRGWEKQYAVSLRWIIDHFPNASLNECLAIHDRVVEIETRGAEFTGNPPPKRVTRADGEAWEKLMRSAEAYHSALALRRATDAAVNPATTLH